MPTFMQEPVAIPVSTPVPTPDSFIAYGRPSESKQVRRRLRGKARHQCLSLGCSHHIMQDDSSMSSKLDGAKMHVDASLDDGATDSEVGARRGGATTWRHGVIGGDVTARRLDVSGSGGGWEPKRSKPDDAQEWQPENRKDQLEQSLALEHPAVWTRRWTRRLELWRGRRGITNSATSRMQGE